MSVYQLSYDVKDSGKTDNNEFRKKIVWVILGNLRPSWIHRPVASTIYFSCAIDHEIVKSTLSKALSNEAYYILSKVEVNKGVAAGVWQKDPVLEKNFAEECEQIKKEGNK